MERVARASSRAATVGASRAGTGNARATTASRGARATTARRAPAAAFLSSVSRKCRRGRTTTTGALAIPDTAFTVATMAVMPMYALMIASPRSKRVLAMVESKALFWVLGACYLCAAGASLASAHVFDAARAVLNDRSAPLVTKFVTLVSEFMATSETAASAWVHLLSLDFFVARFVYLDSAKYSSSAGDLVARIPVRHSLILCCMFGPLGLISHALTRAIWNTYVVVDVV